MPACTPNCTEPSIASTADANKPVLHVVVRKVGKHFVCHAFSIFGRLVCLVDWSVGCLVCSKHADRSVSMFIGRCKTVRVGINNF